MSKHIITIITSLKRTVLLKGENFREAEELVRHQYKKRKRILVAVNFNVLMVHLFLRRILSRGLNYPTAKQFTLYKKKHEVIYCLYGTL